MGILTQLNRFPQFSYDLGLESIPENNNLLIFTMDSLLHVMDLSLPIRNVPPATIIFTDTRELPMCCKEPRIIFLTTAFSKYAQIVYQLAHEMCHLIISRDVPQNLRWLEESICELSSYYFLLRLSKSWRRAKVTLVTADKKSGPYYRYLEQYVKNDQRKAKEFDLKAFCSGTSEVLPELIDNCELRLYNAHIANNLLPIFNRYPDTWHAVPILSSLTPNQPLQVSLEEWIRLSPTESHVGLQKIENLFGASDPLL